MKKIFLLSAASVFALSCGEAETKIETKVIKETDTVVVTETAPKDSFMVFGHLEFPSKDGLTITANSYEVIPSEQYIILCHQAGYSRGEYREIAKELNALGYNCLAIDQRSGEECNDMINETAHRAKKEKKATEYTDARQDIEAAIDYVHHKTNGKVILWGSSYSASLALEIGKDNEQVEAVIAFSPGEYFKYKVKEKIDGFSKPVFVTGSKKEMKEISALLAGATSTIKDEFTPLEEGIHGSSALWSETKNNAEYWTALKSFLEKIKPNQVANN